MAEQVTIQGIVMSKLTGLGMRGLRVEVWNKGRQIKVPLGAVNTDRSGRFKIAIEKPLPGDVFNVDKPKIVFRLFRKDQQFKVSEDSVDWKVNGREVQVKISTELAPTNFDISANQLSLGMSGPDVARLQQAFRVLGRNVPALERGRLGPGSVAVLKSFQLEAGLPVTGIVDTATVNAINDRFVDLATDPRIVRGVVRDANRIPFDGAFVQVFVMTATSEQEIGKAPVDPVDGAYEVSYQPPSGSNRRLDLRIEVRAGNGPVKTAPSGASILTGAGPLEVVDFIVSPDAKVPRSEFEIVRDDLLSQLGDRDLIDLTEDEQHHEVSLLAAQSGYAVEQVAAIVRAHQLATESETPAEVFYGLLRQGLPADVGALHAVNTSVRKQALADAVDQGVVPEELGDKTIEDVLDDFKPTAPAELTTLLSPKLNQTEVARFMELHLQHREDPDVFWDTVAADGELGGRAPELKLTVQLATLTGNHAPLVNAVQDGRDLKTAADLVRLSKDDWKALVESQGVGVPPGTPGTTPSEQSENYVEQILAQVEAAFPTPFFAERLGASPIADFLRSQPFDLRTTYPAKFFEQNPGQSLSDEQRSQLAGFQRVHRLTNSAEETIALARRGVQSAQQIARMDPSVFAERHKDAISGEQAKAVHSRARRVSSMAMALYGQHSATLNRTAMAALPRLDAEAQATAANDIPDWENLFGTFDLCACEHCASVHGPAAYLVDVLQFLDDRGVKEDLFERRPDLGEIELSCENATTVVPYIDLVNEILEQTVSPPAPFLPTPLAPELRSDLDEPIVTAALAAAFQPPLQTDGRVEELETDSRWRIWDESFAYNIEKQDDALQVTARSRQTNGTSDERRAAPQYRARAAYTELGQAVYPWILPFDLNAEEAAVYLEHLGVPRAELIEALGSVPDPSDANSPVVVRLAAERLGLTDLKRQILTSEPLDPPRQPEDFWGVGSGSATVDALATVQALLDRSQLSFAELEELLTTSFVNPDGSIKISAKPDAPVDTCDTTKLELNNLSTEVLSRIHVFVRLWRKLGWSIMDTDRVVSALTPDPNSPTLTNELLVRLEHLRRLAIQLKLSPMQTLAFWKPIDTREPGSLYARLFYDPVVFQPQHEDFQLRPDGHELVVTDQPLSKHALTLQAALRLDATGLDLLIEKTENGTLNLANLSLLYRHAALARQLKISVQELLTTIELTGIDPFDVNRSADSLQCVRTIAAIRKSEFSFAQLDYLLRDRGATSSPWIPTEAELTETLAETRSELLNVTDDAEPETMVAAVADRVSAAVQLRADVTKNLLQRVKHGDTKTAHEQFLELRSAGDAEDPQPLTRENFPEQFATLEHLTKVALVLRTLRFPASQLDWLFRGNPWLGKVVQTDPVPFDQWCSLILMKQVRRELGLGEAALEEILTPMNAATEQGADDTTQLAAKKEFLTLVAQWLDCPTSTLESLIGKRDDLADGGLLDLQMPASYQTPEAILRMGRAIGILKRLGASVELANQWCETTLTDADTAAIRGATKANYDDERWRQVVTPLQDALRDNQREALVGFLLARPEKWNGTTNQPDVSDLYARLLIDVEMTSCQLTSRLVQASGSVQLFAQRCLMGLEPGIQTTDPKWLQWRWMKNYRVWEANRKVWLYPENWIEPELRDNKSPFFQDLENDLLQSDLDNAAAEQAVTRYLEKLDEVSRLEVVGTYEDPEDNVLHVFARTFHTPQAYYYRRREGTNQSWTPWEKVDVDIEGDHLIPIVWNRKLMIIWPIFTVKQDRKAVEMPEPGNKLKGGKEYWEIQLAWSKLQYGRWTGKRLSEPVRFEAVSGKRNILFGERVEGSKFQDTGTVFFRIRIDDDIDIGPGGFDPGDDPDPDPPGPGASGSGSNAVPRLVPSNLITFKALVSGDSLSVRGYLRLDHAGSNPNINSGIAHPFGEFRFHGCRKLVSAARVSRGTFLSNFALAPKGTHFDGMWFTGNTVGLSFLDGKFPFQILPQSELFQGNEPKPLPTDASKTTVNRIDIPVLERTVSPFRMLAPHQDLQFVGNRPSFFMDNQRAFMVTSTGKSGLRRVDWVKGDLATIGVLARNDQPSDDEDTNGAASGSQGEFSLLLPAENGRRVLHTLNSMTLKPVPSIRRVIPSFWSTRAYSFRNFHHAFVCDFVEHLDRAGLDGLLSLDTQALRDEDSFETYKPTSRVTKQHPIDEVEFQSGGAYDLYNWELFFHIPLLIATRLRTNQRFEEAQQWFHYIFDPTGTAGGDVPQRYWRTLPFHNRLAADYEREAAKLLERLAAEGAPDELKVAVDVWRQDPFNPHAIARIRKTAYQKTVVMKYIDNLIAWGDQLFRRDSFESNNEATQLYVLAAEILGRRPEVIQRRVRPAVRTFNTLQQVGLLNNSLEQIELLVNTDGESDPTEETPETPDPPSAQALYFCVPENQKLLEYWDTVADRLFKIRHCMNIEGEVRQLSLFEPPIDPALLVRARAAGLSIGEVLSDISAPLPNYRFSFILQKAYELAVEVRNLGAELLSALERKDVEAVSTLRSGQDLRLLQAIRDVRQQQADEAEANIASLKASREMALSRKDYYESREKLNAFEAMSQLLLASSAVPIEVSAHLRVLAGLVKNFGSTKVGSPTTAGFEVGGYFVGVSVDEAAIGLEAASSILNIASQTIGRTGEYERRQDEWDHQVNLATIELEQIEQQLAAAEIRLAIAEQELRNHDQQIDNAREVDDFLRSKFTDQELYQWMVGQVSGLYFQSYQLAYDLAKQVEKCFRFELGLQDSNYIQFGYWDSLKKGLLAGERLQHDLRRLEAAHLEQNRREFELIKHVSLALLNPLALIQLRETGKCSFSLPEEIFDLDYPGHYFRRIKSVSLTLPCVTGPYTTIACTLRLTQNSVRVNTADGDAGYPRNPASEEDSRFVQKNAPVSKTATSIAQDDSGVFELSFRDERYLPFEGAGAISEWTLELFSDPDPQTPDFGRQLRQFDYDTISDAVLHVKYTAREDGEQLKGKAVAHLREYFSEANSSRSVRLFGLRQEFPTQWHRFLRPANPQDRNVFEFEMSHDLFRILDDGKTLKVNAVTLLARCADSGDYTVAMIPPDGGDAITLTPEKEFGGLHKGSKEVDIQIDPDSGSEWQLRMTGPAGEDLKENEVTDLFVELKYEWKLD